MGVIKALFLDDVPDTCICVVCHDVLNDPQELSPCQHAFCKLCIERWLENKSACPICRCEVTTSDLKPLHRVWRDRLNQLTLKCENHEAGCNAIMRLPQVSSHLEVCGFQPVQCKFSRCTALVLKSDLIRHQNVCKHRTVKCKEGCGAEMCVDEIPNHKCLVFLKDAISEMRDVYLRDSQMIKKQLEALTKELRKERDLRRHLERCVTEHTDAIETLKIKHENDTEADTSTQILSNEQNLPSTLEPSKPNKCPSLPRIAPLHTQMRISTDLSSLRKLRRQRRRAERQAKLEKEKATTS